MDTKKEITELIEDHSQLLSVIHIGRALNDIKLKFLKKMWDGMYTRVKECTEVYWAFDTEISKDKTKFNKDIEDYYKKYKHHGLEILKKEWEYNDVTYKLMFRIAINVNLHYGIILRDERNGVVYDSAICEKAYKDNFASLEDKWNTKYDDEKNFWVCWKYPEEYKDENNRCNAFLFNDTFICFISNKEKMSKFIKECQRFGLPLKLSDITDPIAEK